MKRCLVVLVICCSYQLSSAQVGLSMKHVAAKPVNHRVTIHANTATTGHTYNMPVVRPSERVARVMPVIVPDTTAVVKMPVVKSGVVAKRK